MVSSRRVYRTRRRPGHTRRRVAKKSDIKQVDDVAAAHGLTGPLRAAFGDAVEDAKAAGDYPVVGGKVNWSDLNKIAAEFKLDRGIK